MEYLEFLKSKIEIASESGFEVDRDRLNKALKPHQQDAVAWALKGGRRALFESFGLGKTVQELEFCHQVVKRKGGKALIVIPLGVKQEFRQDAVNVLGYEKPKYVRNQQEAVEAEEDILLTNYERVRDGDIEPSYFMEASLDEASVLRSFGSKTYQTFLDKFKGVPYKLVATATPSPNRYKELIHYAGYLEVMDTGQALTRFFQRDSTKANNLTLYKNQEDEFWLWVSSWALFITKPSDINPGYSDQGYELPPLKVNWHELPVSYGNAVEKDGQLALFTEAAAGLKEAAQIKRESIGQRCSKMREIVEASPGDHFVLWHDLEAERHAINNENTVQFFKQMDFLTPELLRVLKPGRVAAVHVKDRVLFGNVTGTGMPTIEPFHALCISHYMKHGFQYFGMITVLTDVVRENNQTYRLGWSEQCKDGTKMGVGCPEYILLFRKLPTNRSKGYADDPVRKSKEKYTRARWQIDAHGYWRSSGNRLLSKEELSEVSVDNLQRVYRKYSRECIYDYGEHIRLRRSLTRKTGFRQRSW